MYSRNLHMTVAVGLANDAPSGPSGKHHKLARIGLYHVHVSLAALDQFQDYPTMLTIYYPPSKLVEDARSNALALVIRSLFLTL